MKGAQKAEDTRTGVDRPGSAGALLNGGMGRIFLKPSHFVTFCNFAGQTDCAISSIFQEKHIEGRSRKSIRAPEKLT